MLRDDLDEEHFEGLLLMEPRERYDKCVIGVARQGPNTFFVYDEQCVLEVIGEDIENPDEAREYYEFNTVSAWLGTNTPAFFEYLPNLSQNSPKFLRFNEFLDVFSPKSGVYKSNDPRNTN